MKVLCKTQHKNSNTCSTSSPAVAEKESIQEASG